MKHLVSRHPSCYIFWFSGGEMSETRTISKRVSPMQAIHDSFSDIPVKVLQNNLEARTFNWSSPSLLGKVVTWLLLASLLKVLPYNSNWVWLLLRHSKADQSDHSKTPSSSDWLLKVVSNRSIALGVREMTHQPWWLSCNHIDFIVEGNYCPVLFCQIKIHVLPSMLLNIWLNIQCKK